MYVLDGQLSVRCGSDACDAAAGSFVFLPRGRPHRFWTAGRPARLLLIAVPGGILSGPAAGARTGQWLTPGHRRAKTITNCVTNRRGDGPDTPAGVRGQVARANDPSLQDLPARVHDETIAVAIRGVRDLERLWVAVPPGGKLRLSWQLARDFFARATGEPRDK